MRFFKELFNRGKAAFQAETSDRACDDVSRNIIPDKVDRIIRMANSGSTEDQSRLSAELIEKNTDIAQAVSTRINAVLGCQWSFEPGDSSENAKIAAEKLQAEIDGINGSSTVDNFDELLEDLMSALLPGFAISEILWEGGGTIRGFSKIEQYNFRFTDGFEPRIITQETPQGMEIPPAQVIYHRTRLHGKDPARGGLIRPLAWLHCFANLNDKNLLAFSERFGMPFLVVKADDETYKKERNNLKAMIRNFGSSGGGIFTKSVEHQLLQAANGDGNIYFKLKDALANAINQLVLGQTASSGDGGGLSKDNAQSKVRQDILEADCRRIQRTINAQLCVPWTRFNFGDNAAAPKFVLDCSAPEDMLAKAQMIQALAGAGLETDPAEMSERFGLTLTRRVTGEGLAIPAGQTIPEPVPQSEQMRDKLEAMGVAIRAGLLTPSPEIEANIRNELGLPEQSDVVKKAWEATGGIRQPITLKAPSEIAAENQPGSVPMSDIAVRTLTNDIEKWLGPFADSADEAVRLLSDESLSEDERKKRLAQTLAEVAPGDSSGMEELMSGESERNYESAYKRK